MQKQTVSDEVLLGSLFRSLELMKCIEPEFETFKGASKHQALNHALGFGLQAIRKSLGAGFLAMKTPDAIELWNSQMDAERLASMKEIIHLLWACDKQQLGAIEDKLTSGKRYDKSAPDQKLIYISGKISGIEEQAALLFADAMLEVEKLGCIGVNPMELNHKHDQSWSSYMRVDLKALMDCDGIYLLSNWEESPGAKIEHDLAVKLGMEIIYQPLNVYA